MLPCVACCAASAALRRAAEEGERLPCLGRPALLTSVFPRTPVALNGSRYGPANRRPQLRVGTQAGERYGACWGVHNCL